MTRVTDTPGAVTQNVVDIQKTALRHISAGDFSNESETLQKH